MEQFNDKEFLALISLLDDNDEEVLVHVSDKLKSLGVDGIPMLEAAWEEAENELVQTRLQNLIEEIQFEEILVRFKNWFNNGAEDLLEPSIVVAKVKYPDLDEQKLNAQVERIVQSVWINLSAHDSPREEVQVLNKIIFRDMGFEGNREPKPDADLANINILLDNRHGNSIGLGILYLIVAQALDINIYGVNLPFHFILCYGRQILSAEELQAQASSDKIYFYINPLLEGVPFSRKEIDGYLEQSNVKPNPMYYSPCDNKVIIKTLLYNQISCYIRTGDVDKVQKLRVLLDVLGDSEFDLQA